MKLGLIGKSGAGKKTLFEALTGSEPDSGHKGDIRLAAIRVPDPRVDVLSRMYNPRKTIYAQIEYCLGRQTGDKDKDLQWKAVADCDALIHVARNFPVPGTPAPYKDIASMDDDLMVADFMVIEKRLERMAADAKRGKKAEPHEVALMDQVKALLESGTPVRTRPEIAGSPLLRGFSLLSAKPMLVLINNDEEDTALPAGAPPEGLELMVVRGKLEHEISRMSDEEAAEFLKEFGIDEPAIHRAIRRSYAMLGLISFFTVGEDEVRAWTIKKGALAPEAAGTIHSDMQKGFIRAEVVAYDALMEAGSYAEARKRGTVRLEGKTYEMADGDIVNIRFNV
jgi:GTP-binding protein YchF